jgi:hypothetical protein
VLSNLWILAQGHKREIKDRVFEPRAAHYDHFELQVTGAQVRFSHIHSSKTSHVSAKILSCFGVRWLSNIISITIEELLNMIERQSF